jgi:hypothetical protein
MGYESPRIGKAGGMNLKQFIFPKACIDRFVNSRKEVRVTWFNGTTKWVAPTDKIFCTSKRWDQAAEGAFMREIEDEYRRISEFRLKKDGKLDDRDNYAVTRFFFLWRYRYEYCGAGGTMTTKKSIGDVIQVKIVINVSENPVQWECFHFDSGSLLVPDRPPSFAYIPVSPDVALVSCVGGRPCPEALNQKIKDEAKSFYFQFKEFVPRG